MTHQSYSYQLNVTFFWLLVYFLSVEDSFFESITL